MWKPKKDKDSFLEKCHATPVVSLFSNLTHVTYVVTRYVIIVTYRTWCCTSGYLIISYGFERGFLLSGIFYLAFLPDFSRLPWGQQFNLKLTGFHADLWPNYRPIALNMLNVPCNSEQIKNMWQSINSFNDYW